jgi:hypothetical protein
VTQIAEGLRNSIVFVILFVFASCKVNNELARYSKDNEPGREQTILHSPCGDESYPEYLSSHQSIALWPCGADTYTIDWTTRQISTRIRLPDDQGPGTLHVTAIKGHEPALVFGLAPFGLSGQDRLIIQNYAQIDPIVLLLSPILSIALTEIHSFSYKDAFSDCLVFSFRDSKNSGSAIHYVYNPSRFLEEVQHLSSANLPLAAKFTAPREAIPASCVFVTKVDARIAFYQSEPGSSGTSTNYWWSKVARISDDPVNADRRNGAPIVTLDNRLPSSDPRPARPLLVGEQGFVGIFQRPNTLQLYKFDSMVDEKRTRPECEWLAYNYVTDRGVTLCRGSQAGEHPNNAPYEFTIELALCINQTCEGTPIIRDHSDYASISPFVVVSDRSSACPIWITVDRTAHSPRNQSPASNGFHVERSGVARISC